MSDRHLLTNLCVYFLFPLPGPLLPIRAALPCKSGKARCVSEAHCSVSHRNTSQSFPRSGRVLVQQPDLFSCPSKTNRNPWRLCLIIWSYSAHIFWVPTMCQALLGSGDGSWVRHDPAYPSARHVYRCRFPHSDTWRGPCKRSEVGRG